MVQFTLPQAPNSSRSVSLQLACNNNIRTIAFPAISTGAYGFPPNQAASVAIKTTTDFLEKHDLPTQMTFACFDEQSMSYYESHLKP
tara:strand:- start:1837 stop:2097 length:261 start_codon:yes stop_codon:yes gene_type:complete